MFFQVSQNLHFSFNETYQFKVVILWSWSILGYSASCKPVFETQFKGYLPRLFAKFASCICHWQNSPLLGVLCRSILTKFASIVPSIYCCLFSISPFFSFFRERVLLIVVQFSCFALRQEEQELYDEFKGGSLLAGSDESHWDPFGLRVSVDWVYDWKIVLNFKVVISACYFPSHNINSWVVTNIHIFKSPNKKGAGRVEIQKKPPRLCQLCSFDQLLDPTL